MIETQHRLVLNGQDSGPFTIRQLQSMWHAGTITSQTDHWMKGYSEWLPLDFIREDLEPPLQAARSVPAPVVAAVPAVAALPPTTPAVALGAPKTRALYVALALFLGYLGAHNFYAARYVKAVCQLGFSLTVPAGLTSAGGPDLAGWYVIFAGIYLIGEAIFVSKDGHGQKMI